MVDDSDALYRCILIPFHSLVVQCAGDQFQCFADGSCVPSDNVGDGTWDCADGSDECATPNQFKCKCGQPRCVLRSQLMDGLSDCADGSDEAWTNETQAVDDCQPPGKCPGLALHFALPCYSLTNLWLTDLSWHWPRWCVYCCLTRVKVRLYLFPMSFVGRESALKPRLSDATLNALTALTTTNVPGHN